MANHNSDDSDAPFLVDRRTHDRYISHPASTLPSHQLTRPPSSSPSPYAPHQPKSLSGIALRAFCLGLALATGLLAALLTLTLTASPLWRLPFFLAALSTFHFLEFWTTAAHNPAQADTKAYLLTANWPAYGLAHAAAALECTLTNTLFPRRAWLPPRAAPLLVLLGLAAVAVGQAVRSAAMIEAGQSFNHVVQHKRGRRHELVTGGVYAVFRHPSYFGFFWWALGTQLVMGNPVCFVAYAVMLWTFFSRRVRHEEELLVGFFGDDYREYRRRVGTRIPFIP